MLIPAILKNSTTGYKNVSYSRRSKKFVAEVQGGGKRVHLGSFATAEEAATAYARSEYGRADAAKLLQPRSAPTPAGAEAIRQAEREGLTLATSSSNSTGYKFVYYYPKARQQEVQAGGEGWRQESLPRPLRHRRGGGALLRPQGGGQGHRQRSHRAATAAAAAVLNLCGAASVRAQHSDA